MRLNRSYNLTMSRTDLDMGLGIKPAWKLVKSLTETNSMVQEVKTYKEAINNLIYENKWYKRINKELQNLNSYRIWCYKKLPF